MTISRRDLILGGLAATGMPLVLGACRPGEGTLSEPASDATSPSPSATTAASPAAPATAATGATLASTPACGDEPTRQQTEGPYFSSGSPARGDLAAGVTGTPLVLTGHVVTTSCQRVKQAKLDFWQADDAGEYDNQGYRLRGHVFTDDEGRYQIATVVPGLYPGRTRHIHVKAQAPGGQPLTTQLYFPGEAANARDGIYQKECELTVSEAASGGKQAGFTFVLQA